MLDGPLHDYCGYVTAQLWDADDAAQRMDGPVGYVIDLDLQGA